MQPSIARSFIENSANIEKGLCQRFLWLAPEPVTSSFESLGKVNPGFTATISKCLHAWNVYKFTESYHVVGLVSTMWACNTNTRMWKVKKPCKDFQEKYDSVQEQLVKISCVDDLLSGI